MTDAESKAEGYVSSNHSKIKPDNILLQVSEDIDLNCPQWSYV